MLHIKNVACPSIIVRKYPGDYRTSTLCIFFSTRNLACGLRNGAGHGTYIGGHRATPCNGTPSGGGDVGQRYARACYAKGKQPSIVRRLVTIPARPVYGAPTDRSTRLTRDS